MPPRPCIFRQQDATRALRAAKAAGYTVDRMEIDRSGNIVIVMENGESVGLKTSDNEWDAPSSDTRQ